VCSAKECEACGDTKRTLMGVSVREGERERHETRGTAKHGSEGVCVFVCHQQYAMQWPRQSHCFCCCFCCWLLERWGGNADRGKTWGEGALPRQWPLQRHLPHDTAASHVLNLTHNTRRTLPSATFTLSYASEQRVQAGYRWFNNRMHQAGTHPCWPPYGA